MTFVEVNGNRYNADITGKLVDRDWNNRDSKSITLYNVDYIEARQLFANNTEWNIVHQYSQEVETGEFDENGKPVYTTELKEDTYDNSEYSVLGDIICHNNGTVTVKMGKPTAEELLAMLLGG